MGYPKNRELVFQAGEPEKHERDLRDHLADVLLTTQENPEAEKILDRIDFSVLRDIHESYLRRAGLKREEFNFFRLFSRVGHIITAPSNIFVWRGNRISRSRLQEIVSGKH